MTLDGTVKNGVVIFDSPAPLPDGTRVRVMVESEGKKPTLAGLLKYAAILDDLPSDMARNHDHYIHGAPTRRQDSLLITCPIALVATSPQLRGPSSRRPQRVDTATPPTEGQQAADATPRPQFPLPLPPPASSP